MNRLISRILQDFLGVSLLLVVGVIDKIQYILVTRFFGQLHFLFFGSDNQRRELIL
jgi:hypothetical protein